MLDMEIRELPPLRVARLRHVGAYCDLAPVFGALCDWAGPRGLFGPDTRVLGLFHDDPRTTPEAELRSDAAVTVGPDVEGEGDVVIDEVAGGTYAVGILKGPYEGLHAAYTWLLTEWLPASGREAKEGPAYEVYLNDPVSTPPEELLTAIHVPLA